MPHQFTCQQCSTPFTRAHKRPYKFCSQRCAGAAKMTRRVQACEACGRLYLPTFGPRQAISRYCSRACLNKSKAVSVFTRSPNKQHGYVDIKLPDGTWRREHWLIAEQVVRELAGHDEGRAHLAACAARSQVVLTLCDYRPESYPNTNPCQPSNAEQGCSNVCDTQSVTEG
jgi:hypothetical protein